MPAPQQLRSVNANCAGDAAAQCHSSGQWLQPLATHSCCYRRPEAAQGPWRGASNTAGLPLTVLLLTCMLPAIIPCNLDRLQAASSDCQHLHSPWTFLSTYDILKLIDFVPVL
jgi:hypothetical protein